MKHLKKFNEHYDVPTRNKTWTWDSSDQFYKNPEESKEKPEIDDVEDVETEHIDKFQDFTPDEQELDVETEEEDKDEVKEIENEYKNSLKNIEKFQDFTPKQELDVETEENDNNREPEDVKAKYIEIDVDDIKEPDSIKCDECINGHKECDNCDGGNIVCEFCEPDDEECDACNGDRIEDCKVPGCSYGYILCNKCHGLNIIMENVDFPNAPLTMGQFKAYMKKIIKINYKRLRTIPKVELSKNTPKMLRSQILEILNQNYTERGEVDIIDETTNTKWTIEDIIVHNYGEISIEIKIKTTDGKLFSIIKFHYFHTHPDIIYKREKGV